MLDGEDITYQKEHVRSKVIGHLFQDPLKGTAPHMTIEENVAPIFAQNLKKCIFQYINAADKSNKIREHLALLDMGLEDRMKQPVGLLSEDSAGTLTLLMAAMVTPKILLLDEHTAALDPATREKLLDLTRQIVAERKITCLMVTHNMQALELGNRTLMMDSGNIILDVSREKRAGMTVEDLLEQFAVCAEAVWTMTGSCFHPGGMMVSKRQDPVFTGRIKGKIGFFAGSGSNNLRKNRTN